MAKSTGRAAPQQKRAVAMRERLLVDAVRLLEQRPGTRPTTQQLADKSHVSIGTVYRYFASMDALVDELRAYAIRDITTDLATGVGTALGQEPMDAMLTVVEALTSSFERHKPVLSVTMTAADDGQLWPDVEGPLVPLARVIPARLRPDLSERELDDLVFLTMGATASLCLRIALFRAPSSDRDALVAAAARMLLAAFTV